MKKIDSDPSSRAIPSNCTKLASLSAPVRDLAELLAEIAARQLRTKQTKKNGVSDK